MSTLRGDPRPGNWAGAALSRGSTSTAFRGCAGRRRSPRPAPRGWPPGPARRTARPGPPGRGPHGQGDERREPPGDHGRASVDPVDENPSEEREAQERDHPSRLDDAGAGRGSRQGERGSRQGEDDERERHLLARSCEHDRGRGSQPQSVVASRVRHGRLRVSFDSVRPAARHSPSERFHRRSNSNSPRPAALTLTRASLDGSGARGPAGSPFGTASIPASQRPSPRRARPATSSLVARSQASARAVGPEARASSRVVTPATIGTSPAKPWS